VTDRPFAPVLPPATLGVLGGGQLGRMFALAARHLGYGIVALDPDPDAPVRHVVDTHLVAAYDDPVALDELAARCAVVTTEFENPPAASLDHLAARTTVAPASRAVSIAQDRIAEKAFLVAARVAVAPYAPVRTEADLDAAVAACGFPALLKTARLGYDGKGQRTMASAGELGEAFAALERVPCVLEACLELDGELSVVAARSATGEVRAFPVAENRHVGGILDLSVVPAAVAPALAEEAVAIAGAVLEALDYCGVLAVELFVVGGRLLVNELAPRPHNSGHWTLDACRTSQFEQQVRAICGLPLGDTTLVAPVAMLNVLGDVWSAPEADSEREPDWAAVLAVPGTKLHLYGKRTPRPGRKMGHVNVLGPTVDDACAGAERVRAILHR
jgi:5-(carboxyamino)imidazole ribonucleotide synthase